MKMTESVSANTSSSAGENAAWMPGRPVGSFKSLSRLASAGINEWVFFALIFLYHISLTFQGIDLLDEGFHATFYQRIFSDPVSVQYSFFYWFSGIVGGLVLKLAPGLGLWGLRFAGSIVSMATIFIAYRMVRKILPRGIIQISMIILALYINSEPKDIHYNTLSALLYFLAAFLMFNGLKKGNPWTIFLCGAVLGLNVFSRLPNVLGAGLGLAIIFDGIVRKRKLMEVVRSILVFAAGFMLVLIAVLATMYAMGHLDIFIHSIQFLFSLTTTTGKQDGLAGSYGMSRLFYVLIKQHGISVSLVIILAGLLVFFKILFDAADRSGKQKFRVKALMILLASIMALDLIFTERLALQHLTYLFTGLCVISSLAYLFGDYTYEEKLLSFIGLFIMAAHPFGSAPGIMTVIIYSMWISFPMAMGMLSTMTNHDIELNYKIRDVSENRILFESSFLKKSMFWLGSVIIILCVRHIFVFPYFYDRHNRTGMVYGIHSPNTRFIYTSAARAKALNELMEASNKYIKKGNSVLAYDAIPMYHFMTETRPFLPNSTPLFYTTTQFNADLQESAVSKGLPIVVRQNIWMVQEGSGWPEKVVKVIDAQEALNIERDRIFNNFLATNHYQEVWTNKIFSILIAGQK